MCINIKFLPFNTDLDSLRIIKTQNEINKIKKAEQIGVNAFNHILDYIKTGVTEKDIASEIEYFMKKSGAEKTSFDTIVLSGKRTALPHGMPSGKKIKNGEFVLMDFGCVYDGYCSDMTRTVCLGKPDSDSKKIYNIVKEAQNNALQNIKEGVLASDADTFARDVIKSYGYSDYFGNSLGHGVGLKIHEKPSVSPSSETVLKENMVISCEPGIYIYDKVGVRIEDLIVVKQNGIENLTNITNELIIL